jgi:hypothetical protein
MSSLINIFLWGDWYVRAVFSISMDLETRNTKTPKGMKRGPWSEWFLIVAASNWHRGLSGMDRLVGPVV